MTSTPQRAGMTTGYSGSEVCMAYGVMTAAIARLLRQELEAQGLDVLYDHGQAGVDPTENLGKNQAKSSAKNMTTNY